MPNTHGFDIVAELSTAALLNIMHAAWETTDLFPKNVVLDPGPLDGFNIKGGQVQVPESGLGVKLVPSDKLSLEFQLQIQIQLLNYPVPSAKNIDIVANASATVKVSPEPGKNNVALLFGGLSTSEISVNLVGGDPIGAKLHDYITEFVHEQYKSNGAAFPQHVYKPKQGPIFGYTYDVMVDLLDDPTDPPHQIKVNFPMNGMQEQLEISIPIHMRIFNVQPLGGPITDPLGVEAQLVLTTDLITSPGSVTANLKMASVSVKNLVPAGPGYGDEGKNYTPWATLFGPTIQSQLQLQGQQMVQQMNPVAFTYPAPAKIEGFIKDEILKKLKPKGPFEVWPGTGTPPVAINNVAALVLADALVIALNSNPGSDINQLTNFIPAGKTFAIAISAQKTLAMVNDGIKAQFPTLPTTIKVKGKKVKLHSINPSLTSAIHFSGDVTVIDAIAGSIDVDAGYDVDVGLEWLPPDSGGFQKIKANPGNPDVHLSALAWLVSILSGFLLGGVIGLIIGVVVIAIVEDIATNIGGAVITNTVTNAVDGLQAWPSPLKTVGEVKSAFENPIVISPDGLLFGG